jgi:Rod binding domain-containing protein
VVNDIGGAAANAFSQLSEAKYSTASKQAQQLAGSSDSGKIERSAKQFESILLASWLESAEKSFATAPGGNGDENGDPGKNQFQSYAMQAVATSLTNAGGIGIAAMIAKGLAEASATEQSLGSGQESTEGLRFSAVKKKS